MTTVLEKTFNKKQIKSIKKMQRQLEKNWDKVELTAKLHRQYKQAIEDTDRQLEEWLNMPKHKKIAIIKKSMAENEKICAEFEKKYNYKSEDLHKIDPHYQENWQEWYEWQSAYMRLQGAKRNLKKLK
jgi:hypothetical protein